MIKYVAKFKIWYARHQLELAVREEEKMRMAAVELRRIHIPRLERALEEAEIDLHLANYIDGSM